MNIKRSEHAGRRRVVKWLDNHGSRTRDLNMSEREVCISIWNVNGNTIGIMDMWREDGTEYFGFEVLGPVGSNKIDDTIHELEKLVDDE